MSKTYEEKVKIFVKEVNKGTSYAEAARRAGYPKKYAHKRGSELMSKPEIAAQIKKYQDAEVVAAQTGEESISTILENYLPTALKELKEKPDKFIKAYLDFKKAQELDEIGELDGVSIRELILKLKESVEAAKELINRAETEIREGILQE